LTTSREIVPTIGATSSAANQPHGLCVDRRTLPKHLAIYLLVPWFMHYLSAVTRTDQRLTVSPSPPVLPLPILTRSELPPVYRLQLLHHSDQIQQRKS